MNGGPAKEVGRVSDGKTAVGRTVVLHVDDLGGSHGANRAFMALAGLELVTCGSVMVPGPWFREIANLAGANPSLTSGCT